MDSARTLILSPHFDDAILSCWSPMTRNPDTPIEVVTVFSGAPPEGTSTRFDRIASLSDSRELVSLRVKENQEALDAMAVDHRELGFLDNQYRGKTESITVAGDRDVTTTEIVAQLGSVSNATSIYAPAGLGGHVDHVLIRDVGLALRTPTTRLYLYADIPYAAHYGWPSWVSGGPPIPHLTPDEDWAYYLSGLREQVHLEPTVISLTRVERAAKLTLVELYATQFPSLNAGPFDRMRHPHMLSFEVFWYVDS